MDLLRALIQRVMHDKIVAGLVIVFVLGGIFTGVNSSGGGNHRFMSKSAENEGGGGAGENGEEQKEGQPQGQNQEEGQGQPQGQNQGQNAQAGQGQNQGQNQNQLASNTPGANPQQQAPQQPPAPKLEPHLAVDFVRWWLTMALDYSQSTSAANHKKAMAYAKPNVVKIFSPNFYTAEVNQGVANGTLAGSFQPATVQAVAINPDGSVVVNVIGTLSMQSSGSQPVSQSLVLEFLVSKDPEGLRMAGFFNKTVQPQTAAPAQSSEPPQYLGQ